MNRRHWQRTLDAQNLAQSAGGRAERRRQLALYRTADVRRTLELLGNVGGRRVLALGDGLGLMAEILRARGAVVTVLDLSEPRLHEARKAISRPRGAGSRDKSPVPGTIAFVAGTAEEMPFAEGTFDAVLTKSVLIHTDIPAAAGEIVRVLKPGGIGLFTEPMRRNPFVNLYRRVAAPEIWKHITSYFGARETGAVREAFRRAGGTMREERLFFFGFFASVFAFAVPSAALYQVAEAALLAVDRVLLRVLPSLRERCWFTVLVARKPGRQGAGGQRSEQKA